MKLVPILVVLALTPALAAADHSSEWCAPGTTMPEVDARTALGRWYVDVDDFNNDLWSVWIYEESNGVNGLQRHDEIVDDTCDHPELGDTIIF